MKVRAKAEVHDHVLDEYNHQGLTPGKTYVVIGIAVDAYRLLDDEDDPIEYPFYLFDVIDPTIPDDWIHRGRGTDEWYAYPAELNRRGFFEAYHDRDPQAMREFKDYLRKHPEITSP